MKNYKENLTAYIHVIEMCERYNAKHGTDVKPWECVKYRGDAILDGNPMFTGDPDKYTFAISILEAKPVFVGNRVFLKGLKLFITVEVADYINDFNCSWNPPKRETVYINGVELPRPLKERSTSGKSFTYVCGTGHFYFNDYQEFRKWKDYFETLLVKARDKED